MSILNDIELVLVNPLNLSPQLQLRGWSCLSQLKSTLHDPRVPRVLRWPTVSRSMSPFATPVAFTVESMGCSKFATRFHQLAQVYPTTRLSAWTRSPPNLESRLPGFTTRLDAAHWVTSLLRGEEGAQHAYIKAKVPRSQLTLIVACSLETTPPRCAQAFVRQRSRKPLKSFSHPATFMHGSVQSI